MSDFGSSIYRVKPGLKCYMYLSPHGNVIDELLSRSLSSTYVNRLREDFHPYELDTLMGVGEDSQAVLVLNIDCLSDSQWQSLEDLLKQSKIKNFSVYMLGESPTGSGYDMLKKRVIRQGLYIQADDPTGVLAKKHVGEWFGDECSVNVLDAHKVCETLDWNLGLILWTIKSYRSISNGAVLSRNTARQVLDEISFNNPINVAFDNVVSKKKVGFSLSQEQNEILLSRLEQFLLNVSQAGDLMREQMSDKKMSNLTGMPVDEVVFTKSQVSRYPHKTLARCGKILKFSKDNITQPELTKTVALLWAF